MHSSLHGSPHVWVPCAGHLWCGAWVRVLPVCAVTRVRVCVLRGWLRGCVAAWCSCVAFAARGGKQGLRYPCAPLSHPHLFCLLVQAPICRSICDGFMRRALQQGDPAAALAFVKHEITRLLVRRVVLASPRQLPRSRHTRTYRFSHFPLSPPPIPSPPPLASPHPSPRLPPSPPPPRPFASLSVPSLCLRAVAALLSCWCLRPACSGAMCPWTTSR